MPCAVDADVFVWPPGRHSDGAQAGREAAGQTQTDSIPRWRQQPVPHYRGALPGLEEQAGSKLPGQRSFDACETNNYNEILSLSV